MKDQNKINSGSDISVFKNGLLIQSSRGIHFDDIKSIKAIPCYFRSSPYSDESDVDYFIEINYANNKKTILRECEHQFIEAFQKYRKVKFDYLLTLDQVVPKISMTKYILTSLLFDLSPLRIELWTDQNYH